MITKITNIARITGVEILRIYNSDFAVKLKADSSPLTDADRASHELILSALRLLTPQIPIISEESESHAAVGAVEQFWLVDPLDGTKEFLKRTGDFTVNIALIRNLKPVLGVVYAPAKDLLYFADSSQGAFKVTGRNTPTPIRSRRASFSSLAVVASKDHAGPAVTEMLSRIPGAELKSMGSSLKFCMVAEGEADLYFRDVPTMEWDTAAAQCIVECAGGGVLCLDGTPLAYGKKTLKNPSLMTIGDLDFDWKTLIGQKTSNTVPVSGLQNPLKH